MTNNPSKPFVAPPLVTNRKVTGMSAILLPFQNDGEVDWPGFEKHVVSTLDCGLTPAINMDTGYANLIDEPTRTETLRRTQKIADGRAFLSGVFVGDKPGSQFDLPAYQRGIEQIQSADGTPIIFQSFGLTSGSDADILLAYEQIAQACDQFYAFELSKAFAPFGQIYSLSLYEQLMGIRACCGAKHSSLDRIQEWERLAMRDRTRPDFKVLTGNDLAIDMVMYGSDYLLGLSTFWPEAFAQRDAWWASGDARFYGLNDLLQYLGTLTFREPVPAYKHSAAMFLKLRERIATNRTHPQSPSRPESDLDILRPIVNDIQNILEASLVSS